MKKIIVSCAIVLQLVPFSVLGQDFCEGNFDYDKDVDGSDASTFKQDFGRSSLQNPCPPGGRRWRGHGRVPRMKHMVTVGITWVFDGALALLIMAMEQ